MKSEGLAGAAAEWLPGGKHRRLALRSKRPAQQGHLGGGVAISESHSLLDARALFFC